MPGVACCTEAAAVPLLAAGPPDPAAPHPALPLPCSPSPPSPPPPPPGSFLAPIRITPLNYTSPVFAVGGRVPLLDLPYVAPAMMCLCLLLAPGTWAMRQPCRSVQQAACGEASAAILTPHGCSFHPCRTTMRGVCRSSAKTMPPSQARGSRSPGPCMCSGRHMGSSISKSGRTEHRVHVSERGPHLLPTRLLPCRCWPGTPITCPPCPAVCGLGR